RYTVRAWVDRFGTWQRDLRKRVEAGQDVSVELMIGAALIEHAARAAKGNEGRALKTVAEQIKGGSTEDALDPTLEIRLARFPDEATLVQSETEVPVVVDAERARFSTWYELFPRSASDDPLRHGTFDDVIARLPYIASMGFDVLYLPPIHPIGRAHRKGRNNSPQSEEGDPGSPWAIGSEEGGHEAIHPQLGTHDDFVRLVNEARALGIEVAMDLALQCSPDHPWVAKHPQWFRKRPDGTIQYAENPPKKYEDIYPIDFETDDWQALWREIRMVVQGWIERGVRTFRVDNPHTKPFRFWEWLIDDVKREYPDVVFLAEAFTRPKVMYQLAKLGFTQSYTYFAWRTFRWEIIEYFNELTKTDVREFFRPNLWPNTPDILTEQLQHGGRPAFVQRLILAGTLGASYGIYGPAFELQEHEPAIPGREEYLHSEKYEIRTWDLRRPDSLSELIARVNKIRHDNPALHTDRNLTFHNCDNENILVYSKATDDGDNVIVCVVNLDPRHTQIGTVDLALDQIGVDAYRPYQVHDLLTDARYIWHGWRNYVELNPNILPAHILKVRRPVRSENEFEYFA
ncbi:MAG TPA: maltotransferase domain-containing protein, partial [Actinomycetota bacterium]|nr:maltotransferase domain-containing protein [Actinomycetota bacterium]